MSDKEDYYKILGVSKNATDAEIKKPFHKFNEIFKGNRYNDPILQGHLLNLNFLIIHS